MTVRAALHNPLAPSLTGTLSASATALVSELKRSRMASRYASDDSDALRRAPENDAQGVLRPPYVRDSEKIMHLPAYNRLADKTQVFSFRADDDLARRGLHVQLVARIARDIGAALGLNVELIEAIALGHDIGHTPFGHAGERFLNETYHARTGRWFRHNVHSVRVLDSLYGRNLSLQTLDGVICHNGEFEQQRFETNSLAGFVEFDAMVTRCWEEGDAAIDHLRPSTLEGCVVRLSDIIAYVGKDRQDAISAGLAHEKSFDDGLGSGYNSWALAAFMADIVENSICQDRIEMSEEGFVELARAKRENYEKIYGSFEVSGDFARPVADLFGRLYAYELDALTAGDENAAIFRHHIMPLEQHLSYYGKSYPWEEDLDLTVVDFIASMTDDYFMASCEELFPEARELFPRRTYFRDLVHA